MSLSKWNRIPVVWRWRLLSAALLALAVLSFEMNFRKTISMVKGYKELKQASDVLSADIANHRKGAKDPEITEMGVINANASFLEFISSFAQSNAVSVVEITQTYYQEAEHYSIETNKLVLNGPYAAILKLIYEIEKQKAAAVNSVSWEMKKVNEINDYKLFATLYIKRVKYEKPF
jgi:hypothetical protein